MSTVRDATIPDCGTTHDNLFAVADIKARAFAAG
jgi:hypothetical protein